jgi:maleylpyruvate isomerase
MPVTAETIEHVRDATARMLSGLYVLTDADVRRDSLCPGWTVGHVLTHVARSADGLRRSVEGARRSELVPMYDSREARAADIEAGAARSITELVADVAESARLLDEAWSTLDDAVWKDGTFPHRVLGPRPVRETPALRWREVEIHRVDLGGDYGPENWPEPFVAHVLDETVHGVTERLQIGMGLDLHATDTDARWSFGADNPVAVSGPSWALAAWLLGRPEPALESLSTEDGELPELSAWL